MKILLHTCCAPCLVHPYEDLVSEGHDVTALFYNPNIHPHSEYLRRLDAFRTYTGDNGIKMLLREDPDGMEDWFRAVAYREASRCTVCFGKRLEETARMAREKGFDAFSTTLLYSRFQNHELLRDIAGNASAKFDIPFHYRDWRTGWNKGVKKYRAVGLYRQKYCGCIYSEKERAAKLVT